MTEFDLWLNDRILLAQIASEMYIDLIFEQYRRQRDTQYFYDKLGIMIVYHPQSPYSTIHQVS